MAKKTALKDNTPRGSSSEEYAQQVMQNLERAIERDKAKAAKEQSKPKKPKTREMDNAYTIKKAWEFVLYDTVNDMACLDDLRSRSMLDEPFLRMVGIYHNQDTDEKGELKKPHYHILTFWYRPQRHITLCNKYNLSAPQVKSLIDGKDSALKYLVHFNKPDKHRYDTAELFGNRELISRCESLLYEEPDETALSQIAGFIWTQGERITNAYVLEYVIEHQLLQTYRKYYPIIRDIINEVRQQSYWSRKEKEESAEELQRYLRG